MSDQKLVLIVEDEPDVSSFLTILLEDNGFKTETAGNGRIGMTQAKTLHPDLITLDISMPEMDGVNCAQKILDLNPIAKIAFITGYEVGNLNDFSDRIKEAIKTYLTKPVELADLSAALSRMLKP